MIGILFYLNNIEMLKLLNFKQKDYLQKSEALFIFITAQLAFKWTIITYDICICLINKLWIYQDEFNYHEFENIYIDLNWW